MSSELLYTIGGIILVGIAVLVVSNNLKKSLKVMTGWGFYEAYNFSFDYLLWPAIQATYGVPGIIFLIVLATASNFLILLWYQKHDADWLGVTVFEDFKTKGNLWVNKVGEHKSAIKRFSLYIPAMMLKFFIWLFNTNDIFAFVTLTVWQDSFVTTIFLRHGKFGKLEKRDYIIFIASTVISCLLWTFVWQILITTVETALKLL